jgi:hypothetical protein
MDPSAYLIDRHEQTSRNEELGGIKPAPILLKFLLQLGTEMQ